MDIGIFLSKTKRNILYIPSDCRGKPRTAETRLIVDDLTAGDSATSGAGGRSATAMVTLGDVTHTPSEPRTRHDSGIRRKREKPRRRYSDSSSDDEGRSLRRNSLVSDFCSSDVTRMNLAGNARVPKRSGCVQWTNGWHAVQTLHRRMSDGNVRPGSTSTDVTCALQSQSFTRMTEEGPLGRKEQARGNRKKEPDPIMALCAKPEVCYSDRSEELVKDRAQSFGGIESRLARRHETDAHIGYLLGETKSEQYRTHEYDDTMSNRSWQSAGRDGPAPTGSPSSDVSDGFRSRYTHEARTEHTRVRYTSRSEASEEALPGYMTERMRSGGDRSAARDREDTSPRHDVRTTTLIPRPSFRRDQRLLSPLRNDVPVTSRRARRPSGLPRPCSASAPRCTLGGASPQRNLRATSPLRDLRRDSSPRYEEQVSPSRRDRREAFPRNEIRDGFPRQENESSEYRRQPTAGRNGGGQSPQSDDAEMMTRRDNIDTSRRSCPRDRRSQRSDIHDTFPRRDDVDTSFRRDACDMSPWHDIHDASPRRDIRDISPRRDTRDTFPRRDIQDTSPRPDIRDISFRPDTRDTLRYNNRETSSRHDIHDTSQWHGIHETSPRRDIRNTSPRRDARDTSPWHDIHDTSLRCDIRDTSPRRDSHDTSQRCDIHDTSPRGDVRDTSPRRDIHDTSPRRDIRDTSPRQNIRGTLPQSNTRDTTPRRDIHDSSLRRDMSEPLSRRDVRDTSHRRDMRDTSLRRDSSDPYQRRNIRDMSPRRDILDTSLRRDSGDPYPRRNVRDMSPRREVRKTSPRRDFRYDVNARDVDSLALDLDEPRGTTSKHGTENERTRRQTGDGNVRWDRRRYMSKT